MIFSKKELAVLVGCCLGLLVFGKVCYESGSMAGAGEDKRLVEELRKKAYILGKAEGVIEMLYVREEMEKAERAAKKLALKEIWQIREVGSTFYFHSEFSAPMLLNELGVEDSLHYIYTNEGVYAFPVADFGYDEIVAVLPPKMEKKERKLMNGAEIQKL